ncbi:MAG: CCA tRNA nucleotidyltransferase [Candidatus Symbiobacter sp.]|nr:CCA tRNA nucleotidyltransferase [Candidatus Symbiobacter sp.]
MPPQWLTHPAIQQVMTLLNPQGEAPKTRFVGGCVRDWIMRHDGKFDLDLATQYLPDAAMARLQAAGFSIIPTGLKHGTFTVLTKPDATNPTATRWALEITTLRQDVTTSGRHATVAWSESWAVDAARRDFTINALYMDMSGEIYDPLGGRDDIHRGKIRFIGDASTRLAEDYLRLMRYFRFLAWFGRAPPDRTDILACQAGLDALKRHVAVERQWSELKKLFAAPNPAPTLGVMAQYGILPSIVPEFTPTALADLARLGQYESEKNLAVKNFRRLAAMLPPDQVGVLARRLKISSDERHYLKIVTALAAAWPQKTQAKGDFYGLLRQWGQDFLRDAAALAGSRGTAILPEIWDAIQNWQHPTLPINGEDLKNLGLSEGQELGKILKEFTRWWEAGGCQAPRDECLTMIRQMTKI